MKKNLVYFATVLLVVILLAFLYMNSDKEVLKNSDEIEKITEIKPSKSFKDLTFQSADGLTIHADFYDINQPKSPIIILFHQARYSRGEYLSIAPKLNDLGFTCLAVDQRSGNEVNKVLNKTHKEAIEKGKGVKYPDAFPDLEATLNYVKTNFPNRKIIIWGSSYSAALSFVLAQKYSNDIAAVIAFSPGEYFEFEGKMISEYAKRVTCPVFITSAGDEHEYWKNIYTNLPEDTKQSYLPDLKGMHGSSALLETTEGYEEYWKALKKFLSGL